MIVTPSIESNLIEEEDLAQRWQITPLTLAQWRWSGKSPRYIKMGRKTFYRPKDIEDFEEHLSRRSTTHFEERVCFKSPLKEKPKNKGGFNEKNMFLK